jgi:hypothetical protein
MKPLVKSAPFNFGKKTPNTYKILERRFKDGHTSFFVEITHHFDTVFNMKFPDVIVHDNAFPTFDSAMNKIKELKETDKQYTIEEEIIHAIE